MFIFLLIVVCIYLPVHGMPAWAGAPGRTSIGSLVPGATHIEAIIPSRTSGKGTTTHLTIPSIGVHHLPDSKPGLTFDLDHLGNLTLIPTAETNASPPLFFINQDHLWLFRNESAIFPVSVVNATTQFEGSPQNQAPMQLIIDRKHIGVSGGSWKWRGTRLHYHHGNHNNAGVFYTCPTANGRTGVYLVLEVAGRMQGCNVVSLHSFSRVKEDSTWN
ncbi:hypothetical protein BDZ89DRAFT_1031852 [Hymenopellis radicata]|nr:hypothetical protein BDZ89DRAFT_1031852 [Hymenopellis radicata]